MESCRCAQVCGCISHLLGGVARSAGCVQAQHAAAVWARALQLESADSLGGQQLGGWCSAAVTSSRCPW